jgi:glycosidase
MSAALACGTAALGRERVRTAQVRSFAPDSPRPALTRERFYFVMADRFANGDTSNDRGGLTGGADVTGFDPTSQGWFHGGDLKGVTSKLEYIRGLGTTAIWLTPVFKNKPVQGLGTPFPSAGYHGYWITDFTQVDPHLGTNADLAALIKGAHRRGMKVFFDVVTNHTADVIKYGDGSYDYISKSAVAYKDAKGNPFDDRDFGKRNTFPPLDADISFPHKPVIPAGEENVKVPAWLNDVTLYHNRGDTTFSGENALYGDFFGLDDLFTERPRVVKGMEQIYDMWIRTFGIDGYRIDTMKHVNIGFWQQFLPHILATARKAGKPNFFAFGEVADHDSNSFVSRFTTEGRSQAVLDFPFYARMEDFGDSKATDLLRTLFEEDDWYTDADSNAYQLPTFLGNHDVGRVGMFLRNGNPGASEAELLKRDEMLHSLMYLSRGNPVVYFGDEQGFTGAGNDKSARQDMFASRDSEYDNLDNDAGGRQNDADLNNDIGSDVTPASDNFDPTHPLYRTIAALATLRQTSPALADGAQQVRHSTAGAGIFAFSRMLAKRQIEYLVLANNATTAKTATIQTYSPNMPFRRIWGDGGASQLHTNAGGTVDVTVPPLSVVVFRASHPVSPSTAAPQLSVNVAAEVSGRPQVRANVQGDSFAQVSFWAHADGGAAGWKYLGTDDNAPYRVFPDVSGDAPGTHLRLLAVVKDNAGHTRFARAETTVVAPQGVGAGVAIIHYHRADGNYTDWGLHVWGDAIAEDVGTAWDAPRQPTRFDDFGAVFEIPLADASASLIFIIHKPSGDSVPDTREPGGDRSFAPLASPEVWIVSGDPTIHPTKP